MKFISNIAYERPDAPQEWRWKRVGRLYYLPDLHACKIGLDAFRAGLCIAKPCEEYPDLFIWGDILYPVEAGDAEIKSVHVGYVTTSETGTGDPVYSIVLEAMPCARPLYGNKMWLNVDLNDRDGFKQKEECPF